MAENFGDNKMIEILNKPYCQWTLIDASFFILPVIITYLLYLLILKYGKRS